MSRAHELAIRMSMLHAKWIDQANQMDPRSAAHGAMWHCINDLWDAITTPTEETR